MGKQTRNLGIDVLRILSILGVVFLHILGHGGILKSSLSPAKFSAVWFLEILAYPAVNCFVLISGFVGYKNEATFPKLKNLLSLWFTVIFYSASLFFLFTLAGPEAFGRRELVKNLLPAIYKKYWFFSAYLGLFLLSPLLNLLVCKANFRHTFVFWVVFTLLSIISTIYDTFSMQGGYSLIWFVLLYLLGATIKKYNVSMLFSKKVWLILALSAFVITWLSKITLSFSNIPFLKRNSGILTSYVSPTVVVMAVGLLNWFSGIKCPPSLAPTVSFFASSAFSVYLIHDNIFVRKHFISKISSLLGDLRPALLILSIIGTACAIFLACTLIDKIRICLFKAVKIDKLAEQAEKGIKRLFHGLCAKAKGLAEPEEQ